jgi:hypothetical protein
MMLLMLPYILNLLSEAGYVYEINERVAKWLLFSVAVTVTFRGPFKALSLLNSLTFEQLLLCEVAGGLGMPGPQAEKAVFPALSPSGDRLSFWSRFSLCLARDLRVYHSCCILLLQVSFMVTPRTPS